MKVTVLEADSVGSHASGFAFGGLGPLDGSGIPNPLLDFSVWCFNRHKSIHEELKEETGIDTQFHLRDRLNLAFTEDEARSLRADLEWQSNVPGFKVEWLEAGRGGEGGTEDQSRLRGSGLRPGYGCGGGLPLQPGGGPGGGETWLRDGATAGHRAAG